MNIWTFASLIATFAFILVIALLVIRVQDQRATHRENVVIQQATADRVSQEAMTVLERDAKVQLAAFQYATEQARFGQEVLRMAQGGAWGGDRKVLEEAIVRQLDGVAPPHNAPRIAVRREEFPRAKWPDGTTYEERTL